MHSNENAPLGTGREADQALSQVYREEPDAHALKPDYDAAIEFLKVIRPDGPWLPAAIPVDGGPPKAKTFGPGEEKALGRWLARFGNTHNLYFHVNSTRTCLDKKAKATDIAALDWLHVDLDPRDGFDLAEEQERLRELSESPPEGVPAPTLVLFSGGGFQLFWKLAEPFALDGSEEMAKEASRWNQYLEQAYGADECHNVDRIMRLPGTVNRPNKKKREKGRSERLAEVVEWHPERVYSLDQFQKAEPTAKKPRRREKSAKPKTGQPSGSSGTPSLAGLPAEIARRIVEGDYDGKYKGDSSALLLRVVGDLVRHGWSDDSIYAVCVDPAYDVSTHPLRQDDPERAVERAIEKARDDFDCEPLAVDPGDPRAWARQFLFRGRPNLRHYQGDFLDWEAGAYRQIEDETLRSEGSEFLASSVVYEKDKNGNLVPKPFKPKISAVRELIEALKNLTHTSVAVHTPPSWLVPDAKRPNASDVLAFPNNLIDLTTGKLLEASPDFFTRNALEFDVDLDANSPTRWLSFLDEVWPEPEGKECIATLQEFMGYLLTCDTSQHKALFLHGPTRSGKGTIGRVIHSVVGQANTATPTLKSMGGEFGLSSLLGKNLAMMSDARLDSRRHDVAAVLENLLRIIGEDTVDVNRKNRPIVTTKLDCRFVIVGNEVPQWRDDTGAMAARFVTLPMRVSFLGREDPTLFEEKLKPELPGILLWAIDGLKRLRRRGRFLQPSAGRGLLSEMRTPIARFLEEHCQMGEGYSVERDLLWARYKQWYLDEWGEEPRGGKAAFGKKLGTAVPSLGEARPTVEGLRQRVYTGIRLRE